MAENPLRKIWADGGTVCNGWLQVPSSVTAEFMAHQGWDSICLDAQHGLIDYATSLPIYQALSTRPVVPLYRVPWNEPGAIMKALDAGAMGIICPMINTMEECQRFVASCRYAPEGSRSVGPIRAGLVHGADYFAGANTNVLTFAMVETEESIRNLDRILSVPGLDAVYVGPSDLSVSMGFKPGFDPSEPKVVKAIEHILQTTVKHGKVAGIHCGSVGYGLEMKKMGFRFVTILSELRLMSWAAKNAVTAFRDGKATAGAP